MGLECLSLTFLIFSMMGCASCKHPAHIRLKNNCPSFLEMYEVHPLKPFLPERAKILMLGSFPPPRKRWSMDFFYPNLQNDMWRIFGLIFFSDREHFVIPNERKFDQPRIETFLQEIGVALYDAACAVNRLQGNASDKFLEIVEDTPVEHLLELMPYCKALVTTGQKATETLCQRFALSIPKIGTYESFTCLDRPMRLWRMPSSSRAYPLSLSRKAEYYEKMLREELEFSFSATK